MPCVDEKVIGGIDTHKDLHFAAVVNVAGDVLGERAFATTRQGYRSLIAWMCSFGRVQKVGVEQTGSYGAGIVRRLALAGIPVLEVTGPDKADRRARGKDDRLDAVAAARAALGGKRIRPAKSRDGRIEALRVLRTTRQTAVKARRAALQQLRNTIVAAPDPVRDQLRRRSRMQLIRGLAASRPDAIAFRDPDAATRIALRSLARPVVTESDTAAKTAAQAMATRPRMRKSCMSMLLARWRDEASSTLPPKRGDRARRSPWTAPPGVLVSRGGRFPVADYNRGGSSTTPVTRLDYQKELQRLRVSVVEELQVVSRQLSLVLVAIDRIDPEVAQEIVAGDEDVDRLYRLIQADLVKVIARQAPVASDLRLITALLHISRMVERMGDQCVNIAKLVTVAGPAPAAAHEFRASLLAMGRATEETVRRAAEAVAAADATAAEGLEEQDAVVDELNRSCFSQAIDFGDSTERRAWATAMILVSRAFERIADNSVDIGAHLRFAVTGSFDPDPATSAP